MAHVDAVVTGAGGFIATPTSRIGRLLRCNMYANRVGAIVDRALALATAWNYRYHPTSAWQKLRPSSVFIVAQQPG
ncbi:hypothetical protein [Kitasatospora sp. NPDC085879]|uniref:hypothetical protein n=1 Tax=Kitasatospora sp. NPDC085879 TaxID=3154769 RepID=UPI003418ACC9